MLHNAAFHLGLRCLPKYPFRGSIIQMVKLVTGGVRFLTLCIILMNRINKNVFIFSRFYLFRKDPFTPDFLNKFFVLN